jgi:hypothetical protein
VKRVDALIEARRRWGEDAWICGPRRAGTPYAVGFVGGYPVAEHAMGEGSSWAQALVEADALRKRTGFERAYWRGKIIVAVVDGGSKPPSTAEAVEVMGRASEAGVSLVDWRYRQSAMRLYCHLSRCPACSNVMEGWGRSCRVCYALDDVLESPNGADASDADLQARYEAADRYMDRVGDVIAELKRKIDERMHSRMSEART